MDKRYFYDLLCRCTNWEPGDSEAFRHGDWTLELQRETPNYQPYIFILRGEKDNSNETWTRRYESAQEAMLHVFNGFNENAKIKNKYASLEDFYSQD